MLNLNWFVVPQKPEQFPGEGRSKRIQHCQVSNAEPEHVISSAKTNSGFCRHCFKCNLTSAKPARHLKRADLASVHSHQYAGSQAASPWGQHGSRGGLML